MNKDVTLLTDFSEFHNEHSKDWFRDKTLVSEFIAVASIPMGSASSPL